MKRQLLVLIVFVFVFMLSSCSMILDWLGGRTDTNESIYYENYYDYEDNGYVDLYFFEIEEVPYIEIGDFLDLVANETKTEDINIVSTDQTVQLNYDLLVVDSFYTFTFEYDYETGFATVNHIEYFEFLEDYLFYDEYYHSTLLGYDVDYSESVHFDLGKYGLEFRKVDGKDYIELDLANLFFASQFSQIYFTGSVLYKVYPEDFSFDYLDSYYYDLEYPEQLRTFALQFYAFYFDYFYGLNIDHEPGYYLDLFMDEYIDITESGTQQFYQGIDYLLKDFDDLHLWLYFEGYYHEAYEYDDSEYIYQGRALNDQTAYDNYESYCETNYSGNVSTDVLFLEIDSIDDYTPEIIALDLNKYFSEQTIDVVFDLTCNPGGYIYSMHDMIGFFTDSVFEFHERNFKYDSSRMIMFDSDIKQINANLYVLISNSTYSAANVLAAYVQANHLGIIIGENSNGGSSTTEFVLGPGGMIVNSASFFHYSDVMNTYYEYGVTVDYQIDPKNTYEIVNLLRSLR